MNIERDFWFSFSRWQERRARKARLAAYKFLARAYFATDDPDEGQHYLAATRHVTEAALIAGARRQVPNYVPKGWANV